MLKCNICKVRDANKQVWRKKNAAINIYCNDITYTVAIIRRSIKLVAIT